MRQSIELALCSSWIFDLGQQGNKRREQLHGNPIGSKVASQRVRRIRVAGIPFCQVQLIS
jgi:hypothetical protein